MLLTTMVVLHLRRHLSSYSASSLLLITPWLSKVVTVPMEKSEMQVKLISFRSVDSKLTMVVLLMVNFASAPWERKKTAFISDCFIWTVMIFTDNGISRNENRVLLLSGRWRKVHQCHEEKMCSRDSCARRIFSENWVIVVTSWLVEVLLTPT